MHGIRICPAWKPPVILRTVLESLVIQLPKALLGSAVGTAALASFGYAVLRTVHHGVFARIALISGRDEARRWITRSQVPVRRKTVYFSESSQQSLSHKGLPTITAM